MGSQLTDLVKALKQRKTAGVTQRWAAEHLGIMRLSERVRELERRGYVIEHIPQQEYNRHGNLCQFVKYVLTGSNEGK